MSSRPKRSALSKWIFLPVALVLIFMMIWGIWGKKLIVVPEQTQGKNTATGIVSDLDEDAKTFTLNINEEVDDEDLSEWVVDFENTKKFYAITNIENDNAPSEIIERATIAGDEFNYHRIELEDYSLLKDGVTVTVGGMKLDRKAKIKASSIHFGGIYNAPEYHMRKEPIEIYNTAVILCIACVGLGESNFYWYYLILGLLALVLLLWLGVRIIMKRGETA